MAEGDVIMVRQKELKRLHVLHKVLEGTLTQRDAADVVSLSERQIRRMVRRIREEGDAGIRHKARGRPSNRTLSRKLKERIVRLYRTTYPDFGPTLFTEKLEERDGVSISRETVRTWLVEEGLWKTHRKHKVHRLWRERKEHYGEMLQMDGSHHDWFEGRGPACVLMAYIDDATGKVWGRFYEYEGTIPAMDSFTRYISTYGIPMSVYFDKHTTYKSPSKKDDEVEPLSQFGRALAELGVRMRHAHSPQAKGRIERLFKTLQDRLVKEMRLWSIHTIPEANRFLASYLPGYNRRFSVSPKKTENLHRTLNDLDLATILCIKNERVLKQDHTIKYNGRLYQIEDKIHARTVVIEELIDGTMRIRHHDVLLSFHEIVMRPVTEQERPFLPRGKGHRPPKDHAWQPTWFRKEHRAAGDVS
jgi:transposase